MRVSHRTHPVEVSLEVGFVKQRQERGVHSPVHLANRVDKFSFAHGISFSCLRTQHPAFETRIRRALKSKGGFHRSRGTEGVACAPRVMRPYAIGHALGKTFAALSISTENRGDAFSPISIEVFFTSHAAAMFIAFITS